MRHRINGFFTCLLYTAVLTLFAGAITITACVSALQWIDSKWGYGPCLATAKHSQNADFEPRPILARQSGVEDVTARIEPQPTGAAVISSAQDPRDAVHADVITRFSPKNFWYCLHPRGKPTLGDPLTVSLVVHPEYWTGNIVIAIELSDGLELLGAPPPECARTERTEGRGQQVYEIQVRPTQPGVHTIRAFVERANGASSQYRGDQEYDRSRVARNQVLYLTVPAGGKPGTADSNPPKGFQANNGQNESPITGSFLVYTSNSTLSVSLDFWPGSDTSVDFFFELPQEFAHATFSVWRQLGSVGGQIDGPFLWEEHPKRIELHKYRQVRVSFPTSMPAPGVYELRGGFVIAEGKRAGTVTTVSLFLVAGSPWQGVYARRPPACAWPGAEPIVTPTPRPR